LRFVSYGALIFVSAYPSRFLWRTSAYHKPSLDLRVINVVALICVKIFAPETKGKTLEEIESHFHDMQGAFDGKE
jgi:hypothetical protein